MNSKSVLTIPNILSFLRLLLSPVIFFILKANIKLAFFIFVIVSLTDALDGLIARLTNSISFLGKILDPVADKVLIISLAFSFIKARYHIPLMLVKLILIREGFIILGSIALLYSGIVPKPSILGKATTFILILVFYALFYENLENKELDFINELYNVAYLFVVLSFLEYLILWIKNMINVSKYKALK